MEDSTQGDRAELAQKVRHVHGGHVRRLRVEGDVAARARREGERVGGDGELLLAIRLGYHRQGGVQLRFRLLVHGRPRDQSRVHGFARSRVPERDVYSLLEGSPASLARAEAASVPGGAASGERHLG